MSPFTRMLLILIVMVFIGLTALYFMAGRVQTAVQKSPTAEMKGAQDQPTQENIVIFAEARHAIREWLEKHPEAQEAIRDERIDAVDLMALGIVRNHLLQEAGMAEEVYRTIREQYRTYLSGEGELDPAFRVAFDTAPADVMARADLKELDIFDF